MHSSKNKLHTTSTLCSISGAILIMLLLLPAYARGQGPGFPNTNQTPGALLSGPLAPTQGRTAVIAYHQGYLITSPESPGSEAGSDLLSRFWDISDPSNPIGTVISGMGPNTGIAAHGFWEEGTTLRAFNGGDFTVSGSNVVVTYDSGIAPIYYPPGNWVSRGLMFQPFQTSMWWSYGATNYDAVLYKGTTELATWDHIAETGVIGHPFLIGNILYFASDQSNTGIAAYDITPSLNSPGTPPTLIGLLKAPVGGYWPEIWGGDDRLLIFFPARGQFSSGTEYAHFFVADVTDPTNMQVVADRLLSQGGDPGYAQFQDGYAFTDRYKINMRNNFSVDLVLDVDSSGIDVSQFALPIGNLLATGGYPHPPTLSQGLAIWAHQAEPDTTGPSVGYHIPKADAVNYPVNAPISLLIHETLQSDSIINGTTFRVRPLDGGGVPGAPISGRLTYSFDDILTFTPTSNLSPNTTYEVSLPAGGILDAAGNGMVGYSFNFSTGSTLGSGNHAPQITALDVSEYPATPGDQVTISFAASDPESDPIEFKLDFGDGEADSGWVTATSIDHTYAAQGHYGAVLLARDSSGSTASKRLTVTVTTAPSGPFPTNSSPISFSASTGNTWVVNPDNDSVSMISSGGTPTEIDLGVGAHPRSVAVENSGTAWVAATGTDQLFILSSAGNIQASVSFPYGSSPFGVAITPNGQTALVSLYGSGELAAVSTTTHAITETIALGPTPRAIAIAGNSARALVTRFISPDSRGEVWDVSLAPSLSLTRTIALAEDDHSTDTPSSGRGLPNYLAGIAIRPDGARAWVASKSDNIRRGLFTSGIDLNQENSVRAIISEIDLSANSEIFAARRDIDNSDSPTSITFSPLGDYAFVTLQGNNVVAVYDAFIDAAEEENFVPILSRLETGRAPQGSALDSTGERLLVQDFLSRQVNALDISALLNGASLNVSSSVTSSITSEHLDSQVLQGKRIFYNASDTEGPFNQNRMSGEGYISCATCHVDGGNDGRVWDFTGRGEGLRNTTDLRGRRGTGHGFVHWSANFNEIQDFELDIRNNFGGAGFMSDTDFAASAEPFGPSKSGFSADLDALAAYVSSLGAESLPRSPSRNEDGTKSSSAIAGETIFEQEQCSTCHIGYIFTDSNLDSLALHNVGTLSTSSGFRLGLTLAGIDTPTLLSLSSSAPYLHDGSAPTLESVFTTAGGTILQTEDATLTGSSVAITADWGGNYHEGMVVGFQADGDSIRFDGVDGGSGGGATLTFRYSALYNPQQATVYVNGSPTVIALPQTPNNPSWYPTAFNFVSMNTSLSAGTTNTIEIFPVYFYGTNMAFDEMKVVNSASTETANPHLRVQDLSSGDRMDLLQFLRELDGSDDLTVPTPTPSPTPTFTPTPTPSSTPVPTSTPGPTKDLCPNDSAKVEPGICGCGTPDYDLNGDQQIDCLEVPAAPKVKRIKRKLRVRMQQGFDSYEVEIFSKKTGGTFTGSSLKFRAKFDMKGRKGTLKYRGCRAVGESNICSAWSEVKSF